ncbi:helix-turn-helix transcriptional regulator [Streptomyces hebeiensis]
MTRHGELGIALHRWRERMTPAEAGLPRAEPHPRPGAVPGSGSEAGSGSVSEARSGSVSEAGSGTGLRLAELARLTGLSEDYLARLEEGRATSPSVQVLTALARALCLSDDERGHLFLLAGQSPPGTGRVPDRVPASVRRLLGRLPGTPLGVHDAAWNLITWNPLWAALLGDPAAASGRDRNAAWHHFTGVPGRITYTPEQEARFEAALVADLRAATVHYPTDVRLRFLIGELRRVSGRFAVLWNSRITGLHDTTVRTVRHPEAGSLTLECDTLTVPGCDLRITAYSAAPGTAAADRLELLDALGHDAGLKAAPGAAPETAPL